MSEIDLIERIRLRAGPQKIALGIGDDCAIYRPRGGEDLIFTTDQMIEDVHFRASQPASEIGERALARSLSDVAAMGGAPRFCLVSLAVPRKLCEKWIEDFYRGLLKLARKTKTALAGGDLAHAGKIYCDVMVCGAVRRGRVLRRDSARVGDAIFVSGRLGKPWDRRIEPRLALGRSLAGIATSCIDLSDGLSIDLHRVCVASGVAAEIEHIPIMKGSTLDRALNGGEDYELLFTMPPGRRAPRGASPIATTRIGTIVRGKPGTIRLHGQAVEPLGYDHFRI